MSNTRDDIVVLGGREFKRVKNGLDEAQVSSFINELIKERDKLAQSYEHIASLNRLAERTIVEADKLANQIKTEAVEQAKAESAAIIDRAKEQARLLAEKKIAEAAQLANEQAKAIKAQAEQEAAQLLENEQNKIRAELRNLIDQQLGYMLGELENLKQRVAAVRADLDTELLQLGAQSVAPAAKIAEERDTVIATVAEKRDATPVEIAKDKVSVFAEEIKKTLYEHPEPSQVTNQIEKNSDLSNLFHIEDQVEAGKPQWEVEIMPPFEIAKVMEVVSSLDQLPEVANTEMISPQPDMPSILVFLRKPLNLVAVLRTIPAVAYVDKITAEVDDTNRKPRKVRISLSGSTKSPDKK